MFRSRTYTSPEVLTTGVKQGWADRETDPAGIDWPGRLAAAAVPFRVENGRPVSPGAATRVRYGRNGLGKWAENLMGDAVVFTIHRGRRHLLMVKRGDGRGWAVPGGAAEPGETRVRTAVRELAEETGLQAGESLCRELPARYVPDPRASREAWAVTVPVIVSLGVRRVLPPVTGADDAARARWIPAASYSRLAAWLLLRGGRVFSAHRRMLRDILGDPDVLP